MTYAPSASVLHYGEQAGCGRSDPLILGVADELAPKVGGGKSPRNAVSTRKCYWAAATRENFAKAARSSGFVHIATHATFRQDNPMFSSFKLVDGCVTAMDLFSMECGTNLVALSGCKSG